MRILYISGDMGVEVSGRKGASTHIRETCHQLRARGHEVLLVTPMPGDTRMLSVPIEVVEAPSSKWLGMDLRYVLLDRRMARRLPLIIDRFRPDAIYERYSLYQTAGQRVARRYALPRILEINSLLVREMRHRLRLPALARHYETQLWAGEDTVICVSALLARHVRQATQPRGPLPRRIVISPVGVDPEVFHPNVSPVDWTRFGISGKKIVGYAGTLTKWHGVDLLFDAAELLRRRGLSVCFVVIGGEPEKVRTLRDKAAARNLNGYLEFLGSFPHQDIPHFLSGMDVCVIPDTQDWSSPTKYFEMAAVARPVVAADAPAIAEVLGGNGIGGVIFRRGDAEDLVRRILDLLEDPERAKRLGMAARQRVVTHYSWDCNIARILDAFGRQGAPLTQDDRELIARCAGEGHS